jgi:hypothetical protein
MIYEKRIASKSFSKYPQVRLLLGKRGGESPQDMAEA